MGTFKNESEFSKWCIEKGHEYGWKIARFHRLPSPNGEQWRTPFGADAKGWLDLVCVRERIFFVELKMRGRKPTAEQANWMEWLRAAGQEVYLWMDNQTDEVERVFEHTATPASIAQMTLESSWSTLSGLRTSTATSGDLS